MTVRQYHYQLTFDDNADNFEGCNGRSMNIRIDQDVCTGKCLFMVMKTQTPELTYRLTKRTWVMGGAQDRCTHFSSKDELHEYLEEQCWVFPDEGAYLMTDWNRDLDEEIPIVDGYL